MSFEIQCEEIDGVPVFWADVEGPLVGGLIFGVGRAHEPASRGGINHLVEHLVLAPLRQQDYAHNGFVAGPRTVFHASGTPAQIGEYFSHVASTLRNLPLDRLGMERRILRQESQSHQPGTPAWMLWYRFGNRGHGLLGTEEIGLVWLGPDLVRDWATTWFNRANAAMWLSGPPPADLRLPLPDGPRPPNVPLDPIPGARFPGHVRWQGPAVVAAWLMPRTAAAITALAIAARRARDILRFEQGVVYDVTAVYEPLDDATAQCVLSTDCQAAHTVSVRDGLVRVLDDLARDGPNDEEVLREVRAFREAVDLPPSRLGFLDSAATRHVQGRRRESPAAIVAEYEALTPAVVRDQLAAAVRSLLVGSAAETPGPWPHHPYPIYSPDQVTGRTFRPPGLRLPGRGRRDRLIVGSDGVSYITPDGRPLTVRYRDAVAYRHFEGDVRDIIGADGFRVRIAPGDWQSGSEAVRLVDAAIAPDVVACDEHGVGGFEDPGDRTS
jgi:hypothetical protein